MPTVMLPSKVALLKSTSSLLRLTFRIQPTKGVREAMPLTFFRRRWPPKNRALPVSAETAAGDPTFGSENILSTDRVITFLDLTTANQFLYSKRTGRNNGITLYFMPLPIAQRVAVVAWWEVSGHYRPFSIVHGELQMPVGHF